MSLKAFAPYKPDARIFQENRSRLVAEFIKLNGTVTESFIVLQGGKTLSKYDSDTDVLFRQDANFFYAFGVTEEAFYGAIEMPSAKSVLFMPRLPESYGIWMGKIEGPEFFKEKYGVDEVKYTDEIVQYFESKKANTLYTVHGAHSDSGSHCMEAKFDGIDKFKVDNIKLFRPFVECRVHKSKLEIEAFRHFNVITCEAHKEVMRRCRVGMYEHHLESIFFHTAKMLGGTRYWPYDPIVGSGANGATLHYGHAGAPNDKKIEDGDFIVVDMGAEASCFGADITNTIPANGRFTPKQKGIYNVVLKMQKEVIKRMKPGVKWLDMHDLAYHILLEGLRDLGLVNGDIEEMINADIAWVFMPHGLGHLLGLYTHDIGGYHEWLPARSTKLGYKSLRTARTLEPGLFLTVEPGCYFIDYVLDQALADPVKSKYLNKDVIAQYRGFGGVRIEDNVYITEEGHDNLTIIPRTVEEIEAEMAKSPREIIFN